MLENDFILEFRFCGAGLAKRCLVKAFYSRVIRTDCIRISVRTGWHSLAGKDERALAIVLQTVIYKFWTRAARETTSSPGEHHRVLGTVQMLGDVH